MERRQARQLIRTALTVTMPQRTLREKLIALHRLISIDACMRRKGSN